MADNNPIRAAKTSVKAFSDIIGGSWTRNFNSITKNNDIKNVRIASNYGSKILKGFFDPNNKNIAPLIAYYSTQRLFKDASQSAKQKFDPLASRRNGYLQCLKDNAIKGTLVEWLGNSVTSRATKQIKEIYTVDLVLENVEKVIKKTLVSFLDDVREEDIKIYQEAKFNFELFIELQDNFSLPINYYSDGFRNLIYLIVDLIWRSSQLNPWLTLEEIANQQTGCVTIDEIDLHLHPKWQAKAIAILQELLPNVQFFITTHSPTVVANFDNGSLFVINEGSVVKHTSDYFGKEINSVLRNILGASDRHVPTQQKINQLLQLIDKQPKSEVINPLLEELIDQLGEDDPDIQKAIALYELSNYQE
jgi:predicted ATP-binding protein involved in virulence